MSGAAFIRLNGSGLNLETAKQTKIRVDGLLKILRICRFGLARCREDTVGKFRLCFPHIPPGMANSWKSGFFC
jgi:hypothetical protein